MADSIRISALGRDAQVGDLYNYFNDVISTSSIDVPDERKKISETEGERRFLFFYQQPEKFKHHILGINSHLLQSINRGFVPGHQLWFDDYLNTNSMDGDEEHAQVTLLFRVVRRTETLDSDFIRSKIDDYRLKSADVGATHVIDEVVYGAEFICSMRKNLTLLQETKESAAASIYLAAKEYLDETIVKSTKLELPAGRMDQVSCTFLSSIEPGKKNQMSFYSFSRYLQDLLSSYTGNSQQKWKPIEFLLRDIPAARIEARMWADRKADFSLEKERHEMTKKWMKEEIRGIANDPFLKRFPLLEKLVCHFQDLMPCFWKKVEVACKKYETLPPEKALEGIICISNLLNKIIDWIAYRRREIQDIGWLLRDADFELLNPEEIEARMRNKESKIAQLFLLKVEYIQDQLIHELETLIGQKFSNAVRPILPIFSHEKGRLQSVRTALSEFASMAKLATCGSEHDTNYQLGLHPSMLKDATFLIVDYSYQPPHIILEENAVEHFKKEQQELLLNSSLNVSARLPASLTPTAASHQNQRLKTSKDAELTNTNLKQNSTAKLPHNGETVGDNEAFFSDIDMEDASCDQHPTGSTKTISSMQQVYSPSTIVDEKGPIGLGTEAERLNLPMEQLHLSDAKAKEQSKTMAVRPKKDLNDGERKEQNSRVNNPKSCINERYTKTHPLYSSVKGCTTQCQGRSEKIVDGIGKGKVHEDVGVDPYEYQNYRQTDQKNRELHDNRRIAEIYADESRSYSTLTRKGSPNVYLLNAMEKSNSEKVNWFDICRPDDDMRFRTPKNHKIIILMGATGSGKSTLINGMINYILGVRWNDPFRFKCVREDEGVARNQAHSQTSSVTAYTLHHQEGMTIPYSITIIDTPGYGDTRGVKRDKEITAAIHSFLTQQEIPIDEIHAACFVAASGDSRLTATQRYIIDSVLSNFAKDMKANLRLLVTFADNADPPVVGACLSANFPTTSASDSIAYSKFNSSVLYCSNVKQGDDEFSFDELFWDMGYENFKKFFDMLERMKGRDLASTREVIRSLSQLDQSLKDIEQEMEVCLTNIENIEIFQRKMKTCGHNMEANKNFTVEQTVTRRRKVNCETGFFAYNCEYCQNTCEKRIKKNSSLHKTKRQCENKTCKCPPSDHYVEQREWYVFTEKVSKTLQDMKAQYELNYDGKMTAEKILNACSDDLQMARAKVLSLLEQVAENVRLLESTALRSNVLSPSDYLSLMRSRVMEEQAPGYLTRLETLNDLQQMLAGGTSQPIRNTVVRPNQELTRQFLNNERIPYSGTTTSYGEAYNNEQITQPTSVHGDDRESKSGRSWKSKAGSVFGFGKTA